ncbi:MULTISPECIES: hypothetical protein [Streptomyces]|uniref:Integrase n=1 Tax=Streptomyces bangladeshensis TaxID=295352 RepID=A0ABP5NPR2_9ACTN|nr:hypothetical protein [Streptomyces sp. EAS-AB2608]BCM72579.1 hypothetical protein EASAB2608_07913 [Streptomyces sp. EAS-AB2608]CUW26089.1 hypothetical protein TUE45_00800 [Streptomyces reticuli]
MVCSSAAGVPAWRAAAIAPGAAKDGRFGGCGLAAAPGPGGFDPAGLVDAVRGGEGTGEAAPDSFTFRAVHNHWKTVLASGLDPVTIGDILTRIGARAGLDIRPTGHSPRRGLVTESSRAGNPDAVTERQGGWAPGSKVMRRYRERDDGFRENALRWVL